MGKRSKNAPFHSLGFGEQIGLLVSLAATGLSAIFSIRIMALISLASSVAIAGHLIYTAKIGDREKASTVLAILLIAGFAFYKVWTIGADLFPYVRPLIEGEVFNYSICNNDSMHSLLNVQAQSEDQLRLKQAERLNGGPITNPLPYWGIQGPWRPFPVVGNGATANFSPGQCMLWPTLFTLPKNQRERIFKISFESDAGRFNESLIVSKRNGKLVASWAVRKDGSQKILKHEEP